MSENGFGFEVALAEMKRGAHIARLKWLSRPSGGRGTKLRIALSSSNRIRTWYLNYYSDNGVVGTDDILANDWVVVEPASVVEYGR
jgi:hypothetical protein